MILKFSDVAINLNINASFSLYSSYNELTNFYPKGMVLLIPLRICENNFEWLVSASGMLTSFLKSMKNILSMYDKVPGS